MKNTPVDTNVIRQYPVCFSGEEKQNTAITYPSNPDKQQVYSENLDILFSVIILRIPLFM